VILLKNDGILPLKRAHARKIALIGHGSCFRGWTSPELTFYPDYYSGGGSGKVVSNSIVSPLNVIADYASRENIIVIHSGNCSGDTPDQTSNVEEMLEAALLADVVVVLGGTSATEMTDRDVFPTEGGKSYMQMDDLVERVAKERPTVVLLMTPGMVVMPWLDSVAAVANVFLPGEEGAHAWGQMLFGARSPSGKLPISWPLTLDDTIPPEPENATYSEGLFTSYRNSSLRVAFPFGHGLSYTRFSYGEVSVVTGKDCPAVVCLTMSVTNVGQMTGIDVAQAYLEFPAAVATPSRILRGFVKTKDLEAGETQQAQFNFTARDLSIFKVDAGWTVQGQVVAHIGASSADIRQVFKFPDGWQGSRDKAEL